VRDWLVEAGVAIVPRTTRATRLHLPVEEVEKAYWDEGLSASEIGESFGTTIDQVLRCLHDAGIPVRVGSGRPEAMCVLEQLYGDREVIAVLRRHRVPLVREPGPIALRFPTPVPISSAMLRSLYLDIGLAARHIELLTGQPEEQILDALHDAAIDVRPFGAFSPWRQRQLDAIDRHGSRQRPARRAAGHR
jgi:hypothetical protein